MSSRVALVSGASRGIGLAVARTLQQNGWSLSLGLRDTTDVAPELSHQHLVQHDARNADEQAWVQAALDRFGQIDAVVCCAGIMTPQNIVEIDDDTLDAMWEVNVKSPRRLVSAAWEPLKESGQGRVAILASLSGKRVKSATSSSYALTKHAAVALVHGFRQTGWDDGIRATAICPGFVNTDMARAITETDPATMTQASDLAGLVTTAIELPNTASVAEISVNCQLEELF